jgi:hypothetical protein
MPQLSAHLLLKLLLAAAAFSTRAGIALYGLPRYASVSHVICQASVCSKRQAMYSGWTSAHLLMSLAAFAKTFLPVATRLSR